MIQLISKTSMMKLFSSKQLIPINISLFILLLCYSSCHSVTRISTNQPLKDSDVLLSTEEVCALGFFTPSNNSKNRYVGIWYRNVPKQTIVWVANRGNPLNHTSGVLSINTNGKLVLNHVVSTLDNDSTFHPPKQPAYVFRKNNSDHSNQSTVIEEFTCSKGMSTTEIEAR